MLTTAQTEGAPLITLRPYQETCVECVIAAYQQNPRGRAFLVIPTGGGKTIIFTETARRLGLNTLIIAHRQELLQQAADKFHLVDPTASDRAGRSWSARMGRADHCSQCANHFPTGASQKAQIVRLWVGNH